MTVNTTLLAVVAVGMIALGALGLIGLWAYSRMMRKPRRAKRQNSDLVVVHTFKKRKRRALASAAPTMPAPDLFAAGDDSRWQRPGFKAPIDPSFRPAMPFYEPDKPRHVFIAHTPSVIIPHETVGPAPRLSHRTQRSQRTALIKTVRVDRDIAI